ncbi:MAG: hypothetical protein K0R18_496 [Bacillales bacterium]|nr:hypothetical protein [Bacillales bacterium]
MNKKKFKNFEYCCPVCESEMTWYNGSNKICRNGCYTTYGGYGYIDYYVFDEKVASIWDDDNFIVKYLDRKSIKKKIEYWRQDDRYLLNLLSK